MTLQNAVNTLPREGDWGLLQIALRNAFNCIDRKKVLEAVSLEIPEVLAWAKLCYGQFSFLFGPDGVQISSQQGGSKVTHLVPYSSPWRGIGL